MIQALNKFVFQAMMNKMEIILGNGHNGLTGMFLQAIGMLKPKLNAGHLLPLEQKKFLIIQILPNCLLVLLMTLLRP